ncbi:hypothetical protein MO973_01305 [Paenibacillus sp. TRM 82003]|nr:hypothetical protein [Paenibacillus sp. TRM 82003]
MTSLHSSSSEEIQISRHAPRRSCRREKELAEWILHAKPKKGPKRLALFGCVQVDAEMIPALKRFRSINVQTEFSCAGVSLADEPEEHSFYAYVTVIDSEVARRFVNFLMTRMRHRLMVTYEPDRGRYDLSSFFLAHNRSFCFLLAQYARHFSLGEGPSAPKPTPIVFNEGKLPESSKTVSPFVT